ncbi:unnamed protein product [Urochloa humidicola]
MRSDPQSTCTSSPPALHLPDPPPAPRPPLRLRRWSGLAARHQILLLDLLLLLALRIFLLTDGSWRLIARPRPFQPWTPTRHPRRKTNPWRSEPATASRHPATAAFAPPTLAHAALYLCLHRALPRSPGPRGGKEPSL